MMHPSRRQRQQLVKRLVMVESSETLPNDLQDKILTYCPTVVLCRSQAVCKRWRDVIKEPMFTAKRKPKADRYQLMSADRVMRGNKNYWEICDTATHKHYKLEEDFHTRLPEPMNRFGRTISPGCGLPGDGYILSTLAADKGLICVLRRREKGYDEGIYVLNPLAQGSQRLPCFNYDTIRHHEWPNSCVEMIVADDMLSFKIFVLQETNPSPADTGRFIFDSMVGEWQELSQPTFYNGQPSQYAMHHMLKVENIVYTIFFSYVHSSLYAVFSYDTDRDVWTDEQIDTPDDFNYIGCGNFDCRPPVPQLVACSDRIFITAWDGILVNWIEPLWDEPYEQPKLVIWEIDMKSKKCSLVTKTTGLIDVSGLIPDYENGWGSKLTPYEDSVGSEYEDTVGSVGANVLAFGTDDGRIVFTSVTGNSVEYRLSTCSWEHVPSWTTFKLDHFKFPRRFTHAGRAGLFGCKMNLTLCPVPVVAKPVPAIEATN